MKKQLIATAALLAAGSAVQAQLSGPNRPGIGSSPGTFQQPTTGTLDNPTSSSINSSLSSAPGSTGTGLSTSSSSTPRPGQSTGTLGTFNNQDRLNSTLPDVTPTVPNITPPVPDVNAGAPVGNPSDVFRNSPAPSTGVSPRTGVGSVDATRGATDPFATPTMRRTDNLNGIGAPASGEIGTDSRRLTPPPDVKPIPRPLDETSSTATFDEAASANASATVNPDTSRLDRSSLSGGAQAPKDNSGLTTTGVNTPPSAPQQPLDQSLSAKIRAQLSQTPIGAKPVVRLNGETVRDLRITSQNGRVTLEGNANTQQEKDLIELRAREVRGVASIDNKIKVKNQNVGAPASGQSGQQSQDRTSGQSKQNQSDLNDSHTDVTPDR